MGSESAAHDAKGANGLLTQREAMRARRIILLISKFLLVGQKNIKTKHLSLVNARL